MNAIHPAASSGALTVEAYHDGAKSTDGFVDTRTIDVKAGVSWPLGKCFLGKASLSFKVGYLGYFDLVHPTASYKELSGMFFLKILPMSVSRL